MIDRKKLVIFRELFLSTPKKNELLIAVRHLCIVCNIDIKEQNEILEIITGVANLPPDIEHGEKIRIEL